MLYLDITDTKAVLKFELRSFNDIFCSFQHEVELELLPVENCMGLFDHNLVFLSYYSSLAQMFIPYIEEVNFVCYFGQQPFATDKSVVAGSFWPKTGLKGVKIKVEIVVFVFDSTKVKG